MHVQEWKGLMNGILSEEASKLQADFENASARVADWRQQAAGTYATCPHLQDTLKHAPAAKKMLCTLQA